MLEAVSKELFRKSFGQHFGITRGFGGCHAQLESEGTGEDSSQVDSVPLEQRPVGERRKTVRNEDDNCDHAIEGGETCW